MSPDERNMIQGLFDRLRQASGQQRDHEAERFIADQVRAMPTAPYFMSQTMIVQEQALEAQNARIQELEGQVQELQASQASSQASGSGSFLGGIFGSAKSPAQTGARAAGSVPAAGARQGGPWGSAQPSMAPYQGQAPMQQAPMQQAPMAPAGGGGGGFLKGALATAAGVAGGAMLYDGIKGMMGGGHGGGLFGGSAHASDTREFDSEPLAIDNSNSNADDNGVDEVIEQEAIDDFDSGSSSDDSLDI